MKTELLAFGGARAKARMALRVVPVLLLALGAPALRAQAPDTDHDTVPDALEVQPSSPPFSSISHSDDVESKTPKLAGPADD